jgi:hypothetical protein
MPRRALLVAALISLLVAGCAAAAISAAYSERSVGTPEQVAWVRRAAGNFLAAELARNGGAACAILDRRLRGTVRHRTCEQRMDARTHSMLRAPGTRARLRQELRAAHSAQVIVHGNLASIDLPAPLLNGPNEFRWTENCWMLEH